MAQSKRMEERRRTNSPEREVLDVGKIVATDPDSLPFKVAQEVVVPDAHAILSKPMGTTLHPLAQELWDSFSRSGSALYWEPSDWALALILCESISRDLDKQFVGFTEAGEKQFEVIPLKGASLAAYARMASQLMLTEGDRRKAGLEIKRDRLGDQPLGVVVDAPARRAQLLKPAAEA